MSEKKLTKSQDYAATSIDGSLAIVAGAGSGKTTVLIERFLNILEGDWNKIDRVLAITFTEKAAGELKSRLRKRAPGKYHYKIENSWIGTFDSCCARILRQHAPLIAIDPAFFIIDENAANLMAGQAVKNTLLSLLQKNDPDASFMVDSVDFGTAIGALEDLSSFRWHAAKSLTDEKIADAQEREILLALRSVFKKVTASLERQLERIGALDFQGLEIKVLELLDSSPEALDHYRKKFDHILVDEFQDTNDAQTELILKLFDEKTNKLCIVGDPRQSIYRFRGANIDCFTRILEMIRGKGGKCVHLLENFRSRPKIIDFVNICQKTLSEGLFGSLQRDDISAVGEEMTAFRDENTALPSLVTLNMELPAESSSEQRRQAEGRAIASYVTELCDSGKAGYGEIVCLFQALTSIAPYEKAFRIAGVPYLIFGGRGLLGRQEITDLLFVLSYASNREDTTALLGLLRSPLIGLSDDDLVLLSGDEGKSLVTNTRLDERCSLITEIEEMAEHMRPSEILTRVISMTGYEQICQSLDPSGGMTANIDRFISLAASVEKQGPTPLRDFTSFIKELKDRSARIGDPPAAGSTADAVRFMSVHAAKGLEFPIVILPELFRLKKNSGGKWQFTRERGVAFKLKQKETPLSEREETARLIEIKEHEAKNQELESMRLLYVAMTRAMEQLVIPVHRNMKRRALWNEWMIPAIDEAITSGIATPWSPSEKERANAQLQIKLDKNYSPIPQSLLPGIKKNTEDIYTASQIECYDRCPQEYNLRHVIGMPSDSFIAEKRDELPANVVGSIVHSVLEKIPSNTDSNLESLVRRACLANGVGASEKALTAVHKVIDPFLKTDFAKNLGRGKRELPFEWEIDGNLIIGSIDWLLDDNKNLRIIDFKTDRLNKNEINERAKMYELQMIIYALASESATGKKIESTSLIFLDPGEVHITPVTDERRNLGTGQILDIISKIENGRFGKNTDAPCARCPYKHNRICWMAT
ncbi:MAG: ATP-dependent DNA helicase PcrA [bacterium ADurb.Bin270]|nr:MAG: ATP-dependent DNA helicase PcrA [bacterium ADurb.Bin270]